MGRRNHRAAGALGDLHRPAHRGRKSETRTFKLLIDPRSGATQADLDEQFHFLIQIRDKTSEANNAVRTIRNLEGADDRAGEAAPAARAAALKQRRRR